MTREALALAGLTLLACACGAATRDVAVPLESGALERAHRCLAEPFGELRASAPGMHPLGPEAPGRVGRTYELRRFRLPEGELRQTIERAVTELLAPDPRDSTYYVELAPARDVSRIQDAMTPTEAPNARERAALRAYGAAVDRCVSAALETYTLDAGYADASGEALHGVALLDASTRELLWFHVLESWAP